MNIPVATTERDQVFGVTSSGAAPTLAETFALLSKAVGQMGADDVTVEVTQTAERLDLKFRAYKFRNGR
jgi:hypothetical protein